MAAKSVGADAQARSAAKAAWPTSVRVSVAEPKVADAAGVHGVVFSLARADGQRAGARAGIDVDYSAFASAFGADFGPRLQMVALPACVLTTPSVPACRAQTPVAGSTNNEATRSVHADAVDVAGDWSSPSVFALAASSTSPGATWGATSLSPAYTWSAGTQAGDFRYSYPLDTPPSLGEGWDLRVGYIERSYKGCAEDAGSTSDLCWYGLYNATTVFQGKAMALVRDNATGVWHGADDALRVELLTDTSLGNGDNDGEFWKVTTQDGTQYFFGRHKRYAGDTAVTNSVLTQPVFGNHAWEPCNNAAGFGSSWCQQAYRWNRPGWLTATAEPPGR